MSKQKEVLTIELRANLKTLFAAELKQLPELIAQLPARERLDYLLKLMPYVLPKVENVRHFTGEPDEFEVKTYQ